MADISIRRANEDDLDAIWDLFRAHLDAGETCSFEAHTPKSVCDEYWLGPSVDSFVALDQAGRVRGMYRIVPNQPGRGAHVANASYMVGGASQGQGIGFLMGLVGTLPGAYRHQRLGYVDALGMYQLLGEPA